MDATPQRKSCKFYEIKVKQTFFLTVSLLYIDM